MNENKSEEKISACAFSQYILKNHGPLSLLKLQMLLFCCEGYHLAVFEKELFEEEFITWIPGPICLEVADKYKYRSMLPGDLTYLENDEDSSILMEKQLTEDQLVLLDGVLQELSVWKEIELQTLVQDATPWIEARAGYATDERCDVEISKAAMRDFYKTEMGS